MIKLGLRRDEKDREWERPGAGERYNRVMFEEPNRQQQNDVWETLVVELASPLQMIRGIELAFIVYFSALIGKLICFDIRLAVLVEHVWIRIHEFYFRCIGFIDCNCSKYVRCTKPSGIVAGIMIVLFYVYFR